MLSAILAHHMYLVNVYGFDCTKHTVAYNEETQTIFSSDFLYTENPKITELSASFTKCPVDKQQMCRGSKNWLLSKTELIMRKINMKFFLWPKMKRLCALIVINGWIIIGFKHSFAAIMTFQPP